MPDPPVIWMEPPLLVVSIFWDEDPVSVNVPQLPVNPGAASKKVVLVPAE
jgi:hypothetical protein